LKQALAVGIDAVLLDNMSPKTLAEAVRLIDGRAISEASGRITPATAPAIAASGVDLISAGWLTHSAAVLESDWTGETSAPARSSSSSPSRRRDAARQSRALKFSLLHRMASQRGFELGRDGERSSQVVEHLGCRRRPDCAYAPHRPR
jgi:hypothetical protein